MKMDRSSSDVLLVSVSVLLADGNGSVQHCNVGFPPSDLVGPHQVFERAELVVLIKGRHG